MERTFRPVGTTVFAHFASNDTAGSGDDGASPTADVRECGAAVDAAPVYSPTPVLLTHVDYPEGCYEIPIPATVTNGFAGGKEYVVYSSIAVDVENPTGKVARFYLTGGGINDERPIDSTVYAQFASNDTSGSGEDATLPLCKVRLCGAAAGAAPVCAAAGAAPVYEPVPVLLEEGSYPLGCFEVAVEISEVNGFKKDESYAVFVSFTADEQTPSLSVGQFVAVKKLYGHAPPEDPLPHGPYGAAYALCDYIYYNGQAYRCVTAHSPTVDTEPGVGDYWQVVWYAMGEPAGRPGVYLDPIKITFYTWSL